MLPSLYEYLIKRADRSYRHFVQEIEGISTPDALKYASNSWPDHKWGVGQDGSICGIVYHTAAWKWLTLPVFASGGVCRSRSEFRTEAAPTPDDWEAVRNWYVVLGAEWNQGLCALSEDEMASVRPWEGNSVPVYSFVIEMLEHDVQHSSQIEYLKQRILGERDGLPVS